MARVCSSTASSRYVNQPPLRLNILPANHRSRYPRKAGELRGSNAEPATHCAIKFQGGLNRGGGGGGTLDTAGRVEGSGGYVEKYDKKKNETTEGWGTTVVELYYYCTVFAVEHCVVVRAVALAAHCRDAVQ